jgi:hypothetical protein
MSNASLLETGASILDDGYPREGAASAVPMITISTPSYSRFIVDYTISQNTLEQVFIKFARLQEAQMAPEDVLGLSDDQPEAAVHGV